MSPALQKISDSKTAHWRKLADFPYANRVFGKDALNPIIEELNEVLVA